GSHVGRFFFSGSRRHTRWPRDWSSDVCSSDLGAAQNHGPSPTVTLPTALTTASAATVTPPVCADAEPSPPLKLAVVAPSPAPTLDRKSVVWERGWLWVGAGA